MNNIPKTSFLGEFWPHEINTIQKQIEEEIEKNKGELDSSEIIEALQKYKDIILEIFKKEEIEEQHITNEILLMIKYLESGLFNDEETEAEDKLLLGELRKLNKKGKINKEIPDQEIIKKLSIIKKKLKKSKKN